MLNNKEKQMKKWQILLVIVLVLIGVVLGGWYFLQNRSEENASEYSAVFLDNGQVYFGKLGLSRGGTTTLKDIFYLQTDQAVQPTSTKTEEQPKLSLVKLGNELHGPKDEMKINNEHILFTETLKNDGQVVKTIISYQKGETTSPTE